MCIWVCTLTGILSSSVASDEWNKASKLTEGMVPPRLFFPLYFNLINVFCVFDPEDVYVGFCTFRYETRQGSCANRGGDGKGRGKRGDKAGCWYKRKKMQLSLSSTDQSPPRVMHAANMAVLPASGMSLLHRGSVCTENFLFSLSLLIGLCFSFCLAISSCTLEAP